MATFTRVVEERTDLGLEDIDLLSRIVEEWSLLADLALSDLVLWVPTWNEGGLVAVAQVRPTTAPHGWRWNSSKAKRWTCTVPGAA